MWTDLSTALSQFTCDGRTDRQNSHC